MKAIERTYGIAPISNIRDDGKALPFGLLMLIIDHYSQIWKPASSYEHVDASYRSDQIAYGR